MNVALDDTGSRREPVGGAASALGAKLVHLDRELVATRS